MRKILKNTIVLIIIGILFACGVGMAESQYVSKAQKYIAEGKFKAGLIELKNALQENPDNTQARLLLGKLYLDTGNLPSAEKELSRASELGAMDETVLPLMGKALLFQGKFDEIQSLSLSNLTARRQAEILAIQGTAKLAQGSENEAASLISQAISIDPKSIQALVAIARIYGFRQEFDLARKQLDKVFNIEPDYFPGLSLLGDIELREHHPELAEKAYTKAVDQSPGNLSTHLKRAMVRVQLNRYDDAQEDIDYLKSKIPQHPGVNYAQGLIYLQNKKLQNAKNAFDLAFADEESYPQALYYMALTDFLQGNLEQAARNASQFVFRSPKHMPGRKLLSLIRLREKKYAESEALIRPVIAHKDDDASTLNILAYALLNQGKTDEAIDLLSKVAELNPDSHAAQMKLGTGLIVAGNQAGGVEHIESAAQMNPDFKQADTVLILQYLQQKQHQQALKAAEAYRDKNPDSSVPYNLIGLVYLELEEETKAEKSFAKSRELTPGNPLACNNLAYLAIRKKDYGTARSYYQEVLKYHENYLATLLRLAVIDELEKKEESFVKHLRQAIIAHPTAVQPKVLLARYYLKNEKSEQVANLVAGLDAYQKKNPEVLDLTATAKLAQGEFSEAKRILERLILSRPDSAHAHYLLARSYEGLEDRKQMRSELEQSVALAPDYFLARLALARSLLQAREIDAVEKHLKILKDLDSQHSDVIRLEASLARQNGDQKKALSLLQQAFELSPDTSNMLSLARQMRMMNDHKGALKLQEKWNSEHPEDIRGHLVLGNIYLTEKRVSSAMEQYTQVLKKDTDNLIALNNLAWYLRDTQPQQALEYAQRANQIDPESAALMDTYAVILLKNRQVEKAQRMIERALVQTPKNPTMQYHSAMIDASTGQNKADTVNRLKMLLLENADFPERIEASKLLDELESGK